VYDDDARKKKVPEEVQQTNEARKMKWETRELRGVCRHDHHHVLTLKSISLASSFPS